VEGMCSETVAGDGNIRISHSLFHGHFTSNVYNMSLEDRFPLPFRNQSYNF
jgi:hypothetical protein